MKKKDKETKINDREPEREKEKDIYRTEKIERRMKKTLTKVRQVERQRQREKREERNQTISERRMDLNSEYISGRLFSKILKEWYAYKMVGQNTLHT